MKNTARGKLSEKNVISVLTLTLKIQLGQRFARLD